MKARRALVAIVVTVALIVALAVPRQAHAMDDIVKVGLITAAVVGGIVVLAIIGTALTRDDPRFLTQTSPGLTGAPLASQQRLHVGAQCPQNDGVTLVICW
jgi:uncharacterized membrane protein YwzB